MKQIVGLKVLSLLLYQRKHGLLIDFFQLFPHLGNLFIVVLLPTSADILQIAFELLRLLEGGLDASFELVVPSFEVGLLVHAFEVLLNLGLRGEGFCFQGEVGQLLLGLVELGQD